ncbi:MgtC/SapB family protein [Oxalobacteraceae bacterium OM1]|nr:MgtC/SapB family protein [Oxalobacteraceae bacterium OM1]
MIDYTEMLSRLTAAMLIGCIIGLDRNLHGKPTSIKTLGLVALGSALVTMTTLDYTYDHGRIDVTALSHTIQGIITGIGFLGAGVIVHDRNEQVKGLTTAASIWVTAALGIVCGIGEWRTAGTAVILLFVLFFVGRPLERMLHRRWLAKPEDEQRDTAVHEE